MLAFVRYTECRDTVDTVLQTKGAIHLTVHSGGQTERSLEMEDIKNVYLCNKKVRQDKPHSK